MRRRWIFALIALPLLPPLAYGLAAAVLSRWPVPGTASAAEGVGIGVCSNGVHTDLLLPLSAAGADWSARLDRRDFPAAPPDADRVLVGWGDRDFYLQTRSWSDLRPGLAWRALFGGGPSVLHVYLLRGAPGPNCRFLTLSTDAYRRLDGFVDSTCRATPRASPGGCTAMVPATCSMPPWARIRRSTPATSGLPARCARQVSEPACGRRSRAT